MSKIDYYEIITTFNKAYNMPAGRQHTYFHLHIFDEDKSVKWNREEVERQNALIKKQNQEAQEAKHKARIEAENLITDYLQQEWPGFSKSKLENLFKYIYDMCFEDYYKIEPVIDTCEEILEILTQEDKK